jgi:putative ABC transport system permease protein
LTVLVGLGVTLRLTYFRPALIPVTVVRVGIGPVDALVTNNKAGTVTARRRAALATEIGGRVARLPVAEGDHVRKGDVLLALADTDLRAQLTLQERSLDASRSAAVEALLDSVDRVLGIVNWAVSGIGAISLVVGAIGVLTIMWIAVSERMSEIGLLKAIGAMPSDILLIFLGEATILSCTGGAIGAGVGFALAALIRVAFPGAPFVVSLPYVAAALVTSMAVGLLCGVIPARRAARLDPIEALHAD